MKTIFTFITVFITCVATAQPGTLDPTFGIDGKTDTGFGVGQAKAKAVAVQADGKIICAGYAYNANTVDIWQISSNHGMLVRYNVDGTIDETFGTKGFVMNDIYRFLPAQDISSGILSIKVQADGKILTYGFYTLFGFGRTSVLFRFNSDGAIDNSFGQNGMVLLEGQTPIESGNAIFIQPDNKIIVLGALQSSLDNSSLFQLRRFDHDGQIDSTFGIDGIVNTTFGFLQNFPFAITLQADGKIIAVGGASNRTAIARYNANGSLDTTFDGDGKVLTLFGLASFASFVSVYPDGKILTVGTAAPTNITIINFSIVRYNANGSLDNSFDGDGRVLMPVDEQINANYNGIESVVLQPDGKFLIFTWGAIRRYNSDGTVDITFGVNGKVSTSYQVEGAAIQADSKIITVGYTQTPLTLSSSYNITRYTSTGSLDTAFGNSGVIVNTIESSNDNGIVLLRQPDEKLVLVGSTRIYRSNEAPSQRIAMARYNIDGSLDNSFGDSGKADISFGQDYFTVVRKAIIQPDGKIVVGIFYGVVGFAGDEGLIRFNSNGSIDSTFGTNGITNTLTQIVSLFGGPDGKIYTMNYIDGTLNNIIIVLQRFNNNGTIDNSFNVNGTAFIEGVSFSDPQIEILADGKIMVLTSSQNAAGSVGFAIAKFNSDGTVADTFDNNGGNLIASAMFIQEDGKVVVAGKSNNSNDGYFFSEFITKRYNSNGSLDSTYGVNGMKSTFLGDEVNNYTIIRSVALQSDGKFLVALSKEEQNPASPTPDTYDFVLYRINADAEYDNEFGTAGKVTTSFYSKYDEAFSMILQSNNKIVVAGTTDNNINRNFALVRYNNNVVVPNQDPVLSNIPTTQTICSNQLNTANFTINDANLDTISFQISSSNTGLIPVANISVTNVNSDYTISYSSINNQAGTSTLSFIADDGNGGSVNFSFIVNVSALPNTNITQNGNLLSAQQDDATYQWINCIDNTAISGETNQSYTATANGSYAVVVNNTFCSDTSQCLDVTITGLNESISENSISIFPNPTNHILTIGFNAALNETINSLTIFNMLGQVELIESNGKVEVDVSTLQAGVYFIKINTNKGDWNGKFIKR